MNHQNHTNHLYHQHHDYLLEYQEVLHLVIDHREKYNHSCGTSHQLSHLSHLHLHVHRYHRNLHNHQAPTTPAGLALSR